MRRQLLLLSLLCFAATASADMIVDEWKVLGHAAPPAIEPTDQWSILPVEKIVLPTMPAIDLNPPADEWLVLATAKDADRARDGQSVTPAVLPAKPKTPVTPKQPEMSAASKRRLEYWEACERAKKEGAAVYYSDGGEGTKLPAGSYRLICRDGELFYVEDRKIVPRPDDDASLDRRPAVNYSVADCPSCARAGLRRR